MEASYGHSDPTGPERSCDVERARILIRLHADERNTSSKAGEERQNANSCIRLVDDLDVNINVRPEHPPLSAIGCDAVDSGQRIQGSHSAPPPDHVSVIIVVRGLDEDELKASPRRYIRLQH
jgi:hypothetical protein